MDLDKLSVESSSYADKVLTQLWVFTNREDWEMDEVKKHHKYLFSFEKKHSIDFLDWWKEKYKTEWNDFIDKVVPIFKNDLETFLKFRLWALDGNKEVFFSLGEKYLIYWKNTIKLIYKDDIKRKLSNYFIKSSFHDFVCEGIADYLGERFIRRFPSSNEMMEIWQKELQDEVIWEVFYDEYRGHFIYSMYTSLKNYKILLKQ